MRGFAAAAAGLLVLLALAPTARSVGSLTAPLLRPGDTWTYRTNTSLAADFFLEGHATVTVREHAAFTVEGTPYDAYRLDVTGSGSAAGNLTSPFISAPASGTWSLTVEETVESIGMKTIARVVDLDANGTLDTSPIPLPFQLRVQNTSAYRIVGDPWQYPLAVGTTGVVLSELNFTEDFGISFGIPTTPIHSEGLAWTNVTYTIEAETPVDTPAGHFDTFRIRQSFPDGTFSRRFFAPAAGNDVRTETYNGTGTEPVATTELVSYRYQALEPARFFGLTASDWAILLALVVASAVTLFVLRWWLRRPARPPIAPPPPPSP